MHTADWDDVDRSCAWLREAAGRPDEPFMLYLGIRQPHPGFVTSRTWIERIDEADVTPPATDESDHPALEYQRICKNWTHGTDPQTARLVRRIYYAMIAETDAMIGTVLAALDETGLRGTTTVIVTSDHGELALEHGQFYKMSPFEGSVRVPLIVSSPDARRGAAVDDLVSLVDLYPTLMDLAGLEHPAGLDGHSLLPLVRGQPADRPDWVLTEFHDTSLPTGMFMLRRGDWKYIAYVGYVAQLFHLADDPDETRDLAAARPDVVADMDRLLRGIVDYEAVDAKVKEYDRRSFRQWRAEQRAAGTYEQAMAKVFSGWDALGDDEIQPWTAADERLIRRWLGE